MLTIPPIFKKKLFLIPFLVKLVAAAIFGSNYIVHGVLPLVKFFIERGLQNPYDAFLGTSTLAYAYPMSPVILALLSVPLAIASFLHLGLYGELLFLKLPMILADIGILYFLHLLLKGKDNDLLVHYWCSPIVFYVAYMQGQLDIIPIFFLTALIYAIIKGKRTIGASLLGAGIAAKANILAAVPFVMLYLWRRRVNAVKIIGYLVLAGVVSLVFVLPVINSEGFQSMLSMSRAEALLFVSPLMIGSLTIHLAPLLLLLFALRISYYKIMSKDLLIMALAVAFIILVIFVPPVSGWFLWSLPFIIYFFIKEEGISRKHLALYSITFIGYFVVANRESEIYQVFQPISSAIAALPPPATVIGKFVDAAVVENLAFTALVAVMIINGIWVYSHGVINRFEKMRSFFIGISGDSGTGKSTMNKLIESIIGTSNMTVLEGDDLHKWARGDKNWERLTHLDPKANRLHQELKVTGTKKTYRSHYDHSTGTFTSPKKVEHARFVLISGLHSFYLEEMRRRTDLKIFMDPHPDLQLHWKIIRDVGERGYTKAKVMSQVKKRKKDRKKHIQPQKNFADMVISFEPVKKLTKQQIWSTKYSPKVRMKIKLKNSFDISQLTDSLEKVTSLKTRTEINMKTQTLSFSGKIEKKELEKIAHTLIPDIDGISEHYVPRFEEDLNGVLQLLIIYIISERAV